MKPIGVLLAALLLASISPPARANLRAPRHIEAQPSSALLKAEKDLAVAREELSFTCAEDSCQVLAQYQVEAGDDATLDFEFMLPTEQPILAQVQGSDGIRRTAEARAERAEQKPDRGPPDLPLFKAHFKAHLTKGSNEIRVSYSQPLSAFEEDYGYFKEGRFVHSLWYEVWPLREWKLGRDFRLDIVVNMFREPPAFLKRTFGTLRTLKCGTSTGEGADRKSVPFVVEPVQQENFLMLRTSLGKDLPDMLWCDFGDEDLLNR